MTAKLGMSFLAASAIAGTASASLIMDYQFNDSDGTTLNLATNAGSEVSNFPGATSQITVQSGALRVTQGASGTDNVFRNSSIAGNRTTGIVTMDFKYLTANLSGGDASGANVGFGLRDEGGTGTDLFVVRLQKQSNTLRLQHRVNATNTDIVDFGSTTLADTLTVQVVANLDTDTFTVSYALGAALPTVSGPYAFASAGLDFDFGRFVANTNTADWGSTDVVTVDYMTIDYAVPEPTSLSALGLAALGLGRRRR